MSRPSRSWFCLGMIISICLFSALTSIAGKIVSDKEAKDHIGEYLTVGGVIANVHTSGKGNTFLNFGAPYPNQTFTAVVFSSASSRFANLHNWEGRRGRVTGMVKLYKGKPEIILERPSQLVSAP
jgi:DNA/RNA endonuclease YhcR with UshA esterase domain